MEYNLSYYRDVCHLKFITNTHPNAGRYEVELGLTKDVVHDVKERILCKADILIKRDVRESIIEEIVSTIHVHVAILAFV